MSGDAKPASPALSPAPDFVQPAPTEVEALLAVRLSPDETVHVRIATDMLDTTRYGARWLVVTDRRVLLTGPGEEVAEVAVDQVGEVRTLELVGAAQLEVDRKDGSGQLLVHYSRSLAALFSEAAEAIRNLAKSEAPGLPTTMERTRCATCGRLLPERDGLCPFCIRKWDTIKRIARFLAPQKAKVVAFMALSLVMTGLGLLPPYLVKLIIDDVLTEPSADAATLLGWLVGALVAATLLRWGMEMVEGLLRADLAGRTVQDIRSQLYGAMQFLPLRFYDRRQVGNLISRFTQDADRLVRTVDAVLAEDFCQVDSV